MMEPDVPENSDKLVLYDSLTEYPLSGRLITYRHRPYGQRLSTNFNDLITLNLHELLPNILLGEHHGKTNEEIERWIELTADYGKAVLTEFENKCNKQLQTIRNIRREEEQRNKFDTEKLSRLPKDLRQYIQSYLTPETRLTLLEAKHPDIKKDMKKWKVEHLKKMYRGTVHNSVKNIRENYAKRCLEYHDFRLSITTKGEYIEEIFKIIDMYKKAVPREVDNYRRYKKEATKLFMSIVYANKHINKSKPDPTTKKTKRPNKKVSNTITITKEET